jgi:polyvinyl alcohol dehydrogenase (cytochrome)
MRGALSWLVPKSAALAIAILVIGACGAGQSQYGSPVRLATYLANEGRSSYFAGERLPAAASNAQPAILWTAHAPGSISAQPLVSGGFVYWGSWDGYEHATTTSGVEVWSTDLGRATDARCDPPSAGVAGAPTLALVAGAPVLYVGGGDAEMFALNARTGSIIWKTTIGTTPAEFIWGSPALYGSSLYIGVSAFGECTPSSGRLLRLNAATGAIGNVFEVVPRGCTGGGIWGSPAVDAAASTVYVATGDSDTSDCSQPTPYAQAVVALRAADLRPLDFWQVPEKDRVHDGDFGATVTLFSARVDGYDRDRVGVGNKNGLYYAFDRSHIGRGPLWQATIARGGSCPYCGDGSIASSAFDGTALYVGGGATTIGGAGCNGGLRALDPATGATIWQLCLTGGPVLAAVVSMPGLVLAGSGRELVGAASRSGQIVYRFADSDVQAAFLAPAWVTRGVVYAATSGGYLYALR